MSHKSILHNYVLLVAITSKMITTKFDTVFKHVLDIYRK